MKSSQERMNIGSGRQSNVSNQLNLTTTAIDGSSEVTITTLLGEEGVLHMIGITAVSIHRLSPLFSQIPKASSIILKIAQLQNFEVQKNCQTQ
jgi:hypothetical protein